MKSIKMLFVLLAMVLATLCQSATALAEVDAGTSRVNGGFNVKIASTDATSVRLQWQSLQEANEYEVYRDGTAVGSTITTVGCFTDFGLRPGTTYQYTVAARDASGAVIARSLGLSAKTTRSATVRTHYTVLAIAFDPGQASLATEETYLRHRIQFLRLASLGSAVIDLYQGRLIASAATPRTENGTSRVDYVDLVTRRDLPELNGASIVDLVEQGAIDHVWIVKSPVDFWENVLIGNRAIQGDGQTSANTWPPLAVKSSRSFFVNAYLPDERSYDAYAHMVEGVMTSISDGHPEFWPRNLAYDVYSHDRFSLATTPTLLNLWEQFRLADGWNGTSTVAYASEGNSNIGSSHFPPTSPRTCPDYCYYDAATWRRYTDSTADMWQSFPSFGVSKRKLNGYDFGAFNNYGEGDQSYSAAFGASPELHYSFKFGAASYHQWWFAHLPHNPGISNGSLNSWWPYIFDFNRFDGSRIDYRVDGIPETPTGFRAIRGEYGTDTRSTEDWGYWHSQNGFSPGGKAGELSVVDRRNIPGDVKTGNHAIKVSVENAQDWEGWGVGRNDIFYPISRNAHWQRSNLGAVRFSFKPGSNSDLLVGTNPIVRLYKNGGNRIELVPKDGDVYTNLLKNISLRDPQGWYSFNIPLEGNATWEKNVIGYIDPLLPESERQAAKAQLEREILSDLNYVEISIRSTTSQWTAPHDVVTFIIDGLELLDR